MAKVGAKRAAELTGVSKSTIQRAMNSGKLSYEQDMNSRRIIDVSELERVFGLQKQNQEEQQSSSVEAELEKAANMIEMERLKMRVKMLEEKLAMTETQLEDLRGQRDQWQKQASQTLITSQYSQKQAEELRAEIKEREERARERREQRMRDRKALEGRMQQFKADNDSASEESDDNGQFSRFWQKIRSAAS